MSLIHWWPLNGDTRDLGLNDAPLNSSSLTLVANGKIGSCYKTSTALPVGLLSEIDYSTGSYTISGWYKFNKAEIAAVIEPQVTSTKTTPQGQLFGNSNYGGLGLAWEANNIYNDGSLTGIKIFSVLRDNNQYVELTGTWITFDTWYRVTLVWDLPSLTLYLFINDQLSSFMTCNYTPIMSTRAFQINYNGTMGGNGPGCSIPFYMNDVKIYDQPLSRLAINELSKGLMVHYTFEDFVGKNIFYSTNDVGNDYSAGSDLTVEPYVYQGISGYRLRKTTNGGWGSFFRWDTNYQILDVNKKYSISVDVVSLNGTQQPLSAFLSNDNSNNVFLYHNGVQYATSTLKRLKWENMIPNSEFDFTDRVNNVAWHCTWGDNATYPLDVFIANPKLEAVDHATPFTPFMTTANNQSDYDSVLNAYFADSSGLGNNGTIVNQISTTQDTISGLTSAVFSSNKHVRIPTLPDMENITISFWFKLDSNASSYKDIFSWQNSPTESLWLSVNTESWGIWTYFGANNPWYCGGSDFLAANTWYLYTYTFKKGVGQCYLNGQPVGDPVTYTERTSLKTGIYTLGDSYTGSSWDSTPFNGKIADFKIYATALSAAQVLNEYQRKATMDRRKDLAATLFKADSNMWYPEMKSTNFVGATFTNNNTIIRVSGHWAGFQYANSLFTLGKSYHLSFDARFVSGTLDSILGHVSNFNPVIWFIDGIRGRNDWHSSAVDIKEQTIMADNQWHHFDIYLTYFSESDTYGPWIQVNRSPGENEAVCEFTNLGLELINSIAYDAVKMPTRSGVIDCANIIENANTIKIGHNGTVMSCNIVEK